VSGSFKEAFQRGLATSDDQRVLFASFVRSVLDDLGAEISGMLRKRVLFLWNSDRLTVCRFSGGDASGERDLGELKLSGTRDVHGEWRFSLTLTRHSGGLDVGCREANSREDVEWMFANLVANSSVARLLVKVGDGLRAVISGEGEGRG